MQDNKVFKILLCEDDTNLGIVLKNFLEMHDYDVILERDGKLGLAAFRSNKFDICLLDVMMPNLDGFAVAEEIRDTDPDIPLFFLSAKTMKEDIINGYKLGADDYITKPFDSDVLLHKIKAILKRSEEDIKFQESIDYNLGKFFYSPRLRELQYGKKSQALSPKENELLRILCENSNDLVTREQALKRVWGTDSYFNGRSMDVYIAKLRKYIKEDPRVEISNVHGYGFKLLLP